MELLSPDGLTVESRTVASRVATFSIDVETDFGSGRTEALSQLGRAIDLLAELAVPWTAFVEGHFYESRRDVIALLDSHGVDLQLHCYDHSQPNDTPASLRRSAASYADRLGRRPAGYRAHTYRLTRPLFDVLIAEGFQWDSSLMRALAQGRNAHPRFRAGDYFVLDGRLVEFPISMWRGLPIAFNHTHLLLAKKAGQLAMSAIAGPPPLVVYNCHMTDLVRCRSLDFARRSATVKLLYRYLWSTHRGDTFAVLRQVVCDLRRRGYAFMTTSDLYRWVRPTLTAPSDITSPAIHRV
jgi:hypothetical protein